ncbi:MAG: zinc-binding dehydrogenase [bacterium]
MTSSTTDERVVIARYGPADVLQLVTAPLPTPNHGEVRIRIEAAGVSFGDVAQRSNLFFGGAPKLPYAPGYDVVGTVNAIGEGVSGMAVGDRVAALTMFGGYARYVCVPATWAVSVPSHLDAAQVVALVLNYTTAWQMLRRTTRLREGDAILVYGASGGVGSAILDIARHLRLAVAAAASKRWHNALGNQADFLFDERDPSSLNALRQFRPEGFDAAFDPLGGSHVWKTRSLVAKHGKLVAFGIGSAVKPGGKRDLTEVARLLLLLGMAKVWPRPTAELYAMDQRVKVAALRREIDDDLREMVALLAAGAIAPRIGATFALHDAQRAHELLESRNNIGKIVLVPRAQGKAGE